MRRNFKNCFKNLLFFSITVALTIIAYILAYDVIHNIQKSMFKSKLINLKIDWHDHKFMQYERYRFGLGEQGVPASVPKSMKFFETQQYNENGFNGLLSDKISLNRSLPDIRHTECFNKKYFYILPSVSVIIPFFNEHYNTLLRSLYSIMNRSPDKILLEIILVDDHSTRENLKTQLENYIRKHFKIVKIIRLPKRHGLIAARLAGAKIAIGEVLVFLDSHIEVNVNWLPPLLDPISENYKVCTCPFIDVIDDLTFAYTAQDEGARGAFDWKFDYKRLPLSATELENPSIPFKSPIMAGGLFAISAIFFWELGGYDEGLDIWGGEQYELSFKIWQCGGEMYDVPCSRVGHIYRGEQTISEANPIQHDYLHRNYKRVAEVWMDEYKEVLYKRYPITYSNIDAGDLTKQKEIREKLQCKSFQWFLDTVAFDLLTEYPIDELPIVASGVVISVSTNYTLCIDTLNHYQKEPIGVYPCDDNRINPHDNQYFEFSSKKEIRHKESNLCWDSSNPYNHAEILLYECHGQEGNQLWSYDNEHKWIRDNVDYCLTFNTTDHRIYTDECDVNNLNMEWEFGYIDTEFLINAV